MDNSSEQEYTLKETALTQAEQTDVFLRLYSEDKIYARAHENTRSTLTNIIAAAAALLVGFVTFDDKLNLGDLPMASFLIAVGVFGAVITLKQYERCRLHLYRAEYYLRQAEEVCQLDLQRAKSYSYERGNQRFGWLHRSKLNFLWTMLHLFISGIGLAIVIQILLYEDLLNLLK